MARSRRRKIRDNALVEGLILSCTGDGVSSETAQKAIRILCRYYGGQMLYIPAKKENGKSAENLRRLLTDAVGEADAAKITVKIMRLYGNMQLYIPMEKYAFRKIIALEIYTRCGRDGNTMNALARDYNISFSFAYDLWKEGQYEKLEPSMPFLPFLELAENNNHG
jgi:Mor family transcriptional regulator